MSAERQPRHEMRPADSEKLEAATIKILGKLGRWGPKIDVVSAVIRVGLRHQDEVLKELRQLDN